MTISPTLLFKDMGQYLKFSEMQQICAPLAFLGITCFFYMKRYKDDSFIDFSTSSLSSKIFFEKLYNEEYQNEDVHSLFYIPEGLALSALNPQSKIWQDAKELYHIGNGAMLTYENPNYTDIYCFFSTIDNYKINQFYLNNVDVLRRFSAYFDEKARDIIAAAEKNKLILPDGFLQSDIPHLQQNMERKNFLEDISNHGNCLNLGSQYDYAILTRKEMECLHWLMQHKNIEEIALILGKSPRTVEKQLESAKNKFKCYKTSELIQTTENMDLDHSIQDIL